jgi:hypothetical protein
MVMEAESQGDEVQRELTEVRHLLSRLVERRLSHPLTAGEQDLYDRLTERERDALHLLARRPSPGGDPDEQTSQPS